MKVLIVGSGGREHALAWKAAQSSQAEAVFIAPGNAGTALEKDITNVDIGVDDIDGLLRFATGNRIDLTIVGPEAPLVAGIVDTFTAAGLLCFGPTAKAAQLEGSKAFCKDFMARHAIPTASYATFTEAEAACEYVREQGTPIVIKADGLAAGKGVVIAEDQQHAETTIRDMLSGNAFGEAGHRVVIEEFLRGEEASFIVIADGHQALPMASSQDHKARDDGDLGPNTGGMGAYSPAPVVTDDMHQRIMQEVINPTLSGMQADGIPYQGFLYAGVMITDSGDIKVLEFNCRFGDPETQPIMMRLQSDLVELCRAAAEGKLDTVENPSWDSRPALGVVLAAGGYPDNYRKGDMISGLDSSLNDGISAKVFHAGTVAGAEGTVLTNGGRVLCACALGDSIADAQSKAYDLTRAISWKDVYYRSDIGHRALTRN